MRNSKSSLVYLFLFGLLTFGLLSCDKEEMEEVTDMMEESEDVMEEADDAMDDDTTGEGSEMEGEGTDEEEDAVGNAPDFTLKSISGSNVTLSDFKGQPVVLFFFGNTCTACVSAGPKVESNIQNAFPSDKIKVIGLDTWNGNQALVEGFQSKTGVTFDLLLSASSVQSAYSTTYDRLFLIDADGNIAHEGKSATSNDIATVAGLIEKMLK